MNCRELIEQLTNSNFSLAKEAIEALGDSQVIFEEGLVPCSQLLDIYKVRLNHLGDLSGEHAKQLCSSVQEFVTNLESADEEQTQTISISPEGEISFLIFVTASGKLLACLKTISKLAVSGERWKEVWEEP